MMKTLIGLLLFIPLTLMSAPASIYIVFFDGKESYWQRYHVEEKEIICMMPTNNIIILSTMESILPTSCQVHITILRRVLRNGMSDGDDIKIYRAVAEYEGILERAKEVEVSISDDDQTFTVLFEEE